MIRASGTGTTHKSAGVTLIVAGVILGLTLRFIPNSEIHGLLLVLVYVQPLMILGGAFLYWRGRQYAARAKAKAIISESKPDVLYLRSFRSDASTTRQVFSSILTPQLISGFATEEEQLADVLRPFGDLVAIGQPGEDLPKPGAARIYTSDEEWKEVVKHQIRAARLVVIRAGVGENLLWEFKQAIETVDPQKLLILVLNMKAKYYESFRTKASEVLSVSLPEAAALRRFRRVSGFIRFAPNWNPSFLPLRAPYLRMGFKPHRRLFQFALRPVFETFGLEWQPPPVSLITVAAGVTLLLIALFILYAIVASVTEGIGRVPNRTGSQTTVEPKPPNEAPATTESKPSKEEFQSRAFLLTIASGINKSLPMMVDKDTELRKVTAGERTIIYNYTLVNYASEELDRDKFLAAMKDRIESQACHNEKMKIFWENGVSAHYTYAGNNGRPVGKIVVTPERCGF